MRFLEQNNQDTPLVSIWVFNYNYGRYLRECLQSIVDQTYPNIEINFSDNASTDESWEIALEYKEKYSGIFNLAGNRVNLGSHANIFNCAFTTKGKYFVEMCSDDALAPGFVEKCVNALKNNNDCAFAMVNRAIMDEYSNVTEEPPFYNQSCIVPGAEQAAVYMMAAVNPSVSQVMYDHQKVMQGGPNAFHGIAGRWYATRAMDFDLCCKHNMAYIAEPLLFHRLHGENDSLNAAGNLIEIVGPFLLHQQFAETANTCGYKKVSERLPAATEKLSQLCLRYCTRFLVDGKDDIGEQYFHLSAALSLSVKKEDTFKQIKNYWEASQKEKKKIILKLQELENLVTRKISYEPPLGSQELNVNTGLIK